jgi:hypothetical protein
MTIDQPILGSTELTCSSRAGNCSRIRSAIFSAVNIDRDQKQCITLGFRRPEELTQRKTTRLIEGFVSNPLLSDVS